MSTKVKGDKIKEGSIPLSALDNAIKKELGNKLGFYGYYGSLGKNVKNIDTDMYHMGTIFVVHGNNFRELRKGTYDLSEFFNGPSATLTVYEKESMLSLELQDTSGGYWNNIDIYEGYNKPPQETPDWNAQKGEAGYIENKPFSIEHVDTSLQPHYSEDLGRVIHAYAEGREAIRLDNDYTIVFTHINHSPLNNPFSVPNMIGEYEIVNDYEEVFTLEVVEYEDSLCVQIYGGPEDILNIEYDIVKTLKGQYIDNSVIKTTPQTLSTNDKNQALANLGIDPVVWKYICNPLRLGGDTEIPEELIGEKFYRDDVELYKFKYLIPSMYIIVDDIDIVVTSIEQDYDYDNTKSIGFYKGDSNTVIYIYPDSHKEVRYRY